MNLLYRNIFFKNVVPSYMMKFGCYSVLNKKSFSSSISTKGEINNKEINILSNEGKKVCEVLNKKNTYKLLMDLTKTKLCLLNTFVACSTYVYFTPIGGFLLWKFLLFTGGTLSISMSTQVFNQIIEKDYDKIMKRTHMRPLPKSKITTSKAMLIGSSLWLSSAGLYYLVNPYAILFSNAILGLYLFAYTPLKRYNNTAMHIGAIVGGLPALLGSFAATGILNLEEALLLAGYIIAWQYPHFYGILYNNKDDYKKAGFKFISNYDERTYIAYLQMLVAMAVMLYISYRLYKKNVIGDITGTLFSILFAMNICKVALFITNPRKYAVPVMCSSYGHFMTILLSFTAAGVLKRYDYNDIKIFTKENYHYLKQRFNFIKSQQ